MSNKFISCHADGTVHGTSTVKFLMSQVGANTHRNLAALYDDSRLTYIDFVRDMKFSSGICFISEELANALEMKKDQDGQLVWIPFKTKKQKEIK